MKITFFISLFLLFVTVLPAQVAERPPDHFKQVEKVAQDSAAATLDTAVVDFDGHDLVLIGEGVDSIVNIIKEVKEQVKNDQPKTVIDWVLLLKALSSGALAMLITLLSRYYKLLSQLLSRIKSNFKIVFIVSGIISGAWTYLESGVDFSAWGEKWVMVLGIAVSVYEFIVKKKLKTPKPE